MDKEAKYGLIGLLLFALLPAMALSYSFTQMPSHNSVVVVNKEMILGQYVRELSLHRLPEKEIERLTLKFRASLQAALQTYAAYHHVVILDKKIVLAANKDATTEIMRLVASNMKNPS